MTKRLIMLLAALLLLGFAVAGCSGDEGDDGNGAADTATDTATTQEDTATDETVTETETDTGDGGGATAPGSREEAAEQCRESVASVPQLSESAKDEVRDFCDAIGSGDEQEIRDAARDVCETVVDETVPEGTPGRKAALDACTRSIEEQQAP